MTLQSVHDYCRTFEAAELQKHKFNIPALAGTERLLYPLRKLKVHEKTTAGFCKFCGYKHPFTRPPRCSPLGEKNARNVRRKDSFNKELSAEGLQVAAVEHDTPLNHIFWLC